jgi:hypothetical protein
MTFIDDILEATEEQESPSSYVYWGCLSAISAVVKKNIWLNRYNAGKLYLNTYVLLVGPAGIKKSLGIEVAEKLTTQINNTNIISGRGSIQAVIAELANTKTREGGGAPNTSATALLASGEFSTFLVKDDSALPLLIDLYDPRDLWKNRLKGSGVEVLKDTYITMIAASNQELLDTVLTSAVAMGGFISRTIVVIEDSTTKFNSLVHPPKVDLNYLKMSQRLREISKLYGPMTFAKGAANYFDDWYHEFRRKSLMVDDRHGIARRLDTQVLKVAMLNSLAESNDLQITAEQLEAAITRCMRHGAEAHRITMTSGKQPLAAQMNALIEDLALRPDHQMTRTQILKKYSRDMNHHDLDTIIETMSQMKALYIHTRGRDTVYELDKAFATNYLEFMKRGDK